VTFSNLHTSISLVFSSILMRLISSIVIAEQAYEICHCKLKVYLTDSCTTFSLTLLAYSVYKRWFLEVSKTMISWALKWSSNLCTKRLWSNGLLIVWGKSSNASFKVVCT
jgi:hypothetical protein